MAFTPQDLIEFLPADRSACLVAYSGGLDSHVLLYALCKLRDSGHFKGNIRAVHVNHGLSAHASKWSNHCQLVCQSLQVSLEVTSISVKQEGKGIEDSARQGRLQVFEQLLGPGEYLLTAHHLDDQVETQLFRLMRGTGLRGLVGIRHTREFGQGSMCRPLLSFGREELLEYARQEQLVWIEDESNEDEGLDRNFLRHKILPLLTQRWPGYKKNWQRLAQLAGEGQVLQQELGQLDLAKVREGLHRLSIPQLLEFSPLRQRNILRTWFLALEASHGIPVPDYYVVERILTELVPAAEDGQPEVSWNKEGKLLTVRRFAERIYLVQDTKADLEENPLILEKGHALQLPGELGTLSLVETESEGFELFESPMKVGFRQGGETAKPAGRKTRSLKKILQDYHVPPWLRSKIPLVYLEGELLAVGDLFICEPRQVKNATNPTRGQKKLYRIQWDRADLHCGY